LTWIFAILLEIGKRLHLDFESDKFCQTVLDCRAKFKRKDSPGGLALFLETNQTNHLLGDGWSIRKIRHCWRYNIYGLDAIELQLSGGRVIRIGTDEPGTLSRAIDAAIAAKA